MASNHASTAAKANPMLHGYLPIQKVLSPDSSGFDGN